MNTTNECKKHRSVKINSLTKVKKNTPLLYVYALIYIQMERVSVWESDWLCAPRHVL